MLIEEEIGMQVRNKLGKGSFGTVYECFNPRNHSTYAVKVTLYWKTGFLQERLHQGEIASIQEGVRHFGGDSASQYCQIPLLPGNRKLSVHNDGIHSWRHAKGPNKAEEIAKTKFHRGGDLQGH